MAKIRPNLEQENAFRYVCGALKDLGLYNKILNTEDGLEFVLTVKGSEKANVSISREAASAVLREVMKNMKKETIAQAKKGNIDLDDEDQQLLDCIK